LRAFVDGQSLSRTAEETLSQSDNLAWDGLSLGIDTECANLKADLAPLGLYSNGASFLEFKATKAYCGIWYLRYLKKSLGPSDFGPVRPILESARSAVTAFLELPEAVVVHLPLPSFTCLWYCLLLLCKLTVLAPSAIWIDRDELGRSQAGNSFSLLSTNSPCFPEEMTSGGHAHEP